jgi:hypothetical protein
MCLKLWELVPMFWEGFRSRNVCRSAVEYGKNTMQKHYKWQKCVERCGKAGECMGKIADVSRRVQKMSWYVTLREVLQNLMIGDVVPVAYCL